MSTILEVINENERKTKLIANKKYESFNIDDMMSKMANY